MTARPLRRRSARVTVLTRLGELTHRDIAARIAAQTKANVLVAHAPSTTLT